MDLNALKEFAAIATEGSFAAAARKLGTPKSTVSKRIQDLEAALGVQLIERTTRKLRLTAEGAMVLARAERILSDASEITQALNDTGDSISGHLRIAVPVLFGQAFMGQIAAVCRRLYPDLSLEIVLTDSQPDLIEDGFDAALRIGHPAHSALIAQPIATAHRVVVVAPDVLQSIPETPADLTGLPILLAGVGLVQTWYFQNGREQASVRLAGRLAMTSEPALRDATLGAAGLALLPLFLVEEDLAAGRLIQLLQHWECAPTELTLVYPSAQSLTARLRVVLDVIQGAFPDGTLHGGLLRCRT
ncbi:LysR family transcriptional regulator [Pseudoruegeria sp. SK021]|uniref:LysR family transcriptional regulator n=1 Tax=Pseudoruegeria sp. SK021 TaxID=1933035 RepID=UPI000A24FD0C|nr:LysR family transcriptional regulator [Pseudoruegeria sp. SK021]OSP56613.1 hypothetical protein BV911_01250 [Pseudoruegeria sp. SK021]